MKKILVLHTGGTISMQADEAGHVRPENDNPMNHVGVNLDNIQVTALDFFNVPSPHITPKHMLKLYQKIKEEADNFDGVVITHGTDTLEETAYFLDTMEVSNIPIVLTGAMRSSNELGSDGVYNYISALRVASHEKAVGKGVLVVMNDEIHAAKYVTKTHTTNVSTFKTPIHGPLGIIMKHDILFFRTAEPRVRLTYKIFQVLFQLSEPMLVWVAMVSLASLIQATFKVWSSKHLVLETCHHALPKKSTTSSSKASLLSLSHVALTELLNLFMPTKEAGFNSLTLGLCSSKSSMPKKPA